MLEIIHLQSINFKQVKISWYVLLLLHIKTFADKLKNSPSNLLLVTNFWEGTAVDGTQRNHKN